jgi:putative aminopeptidase FrvX
MTELAFNVAEMTNFLVGLLNTPSPTGYHKEAIAVCRQAFEALDFPNATICETRKGALLLHIKGTRDDAPVGLTAHVDTLGFMVKEIKSNGGLKLTSLGGIKPMMINGIAALLSCMTHLRTSIATPTKKSVMKIRWKFVLMLVPAIGVRLKHWVSG